MGLSQKQLGIAAGLDPFVASTRINRYELGIHKVDYQFAGKLATVLSIPVAYLYADNPMLAELIDAFGRLPRERQGQLLSYASDLLEQ